MKTPLMHTFFLAVTALSAIALQAGTTPKLIRHFTFDENFQESVYGHPPEEIIGNPSLAPGVSGQGVQLNGQSALVYDNYFDLNLETFTLTGWVYPGVENPTGHFASKGANSYWIFINQGEIRAGFHDGDYREGYSGIYLQPGQWYFIAISYDGDALRLYINNHLHWIRKVKSAPRRVDGAFIIGAKGTKPPHSYLKATIDEVRLYDGGLSKAEILELYKAK